MGNVIDATRDAQKEIGRDLIITGFIRGTHSLDGTLVIESCSGDFRHYATLKDVWLLPKNSVLTAGEKNTFNKSNNDATDPYRDASHYCVEGVDTSHGWLKLSGVTTVEKATALKGCAILVDRSCARPLESDEWYIDDLIGCKIYGTSNSGDTTNIKKENVLDAIDALGCVTGVIDGGNGELLEVDGAKYIPLDYRYLKSIDVSNKAIVLRVRWILE